MTATLATKTFGLPNRGGFSLIELMIALAVLVILAGIAFPLYNGYIREARLGTARMNMNSMRVALEDFRLDNGTYNANGNSPFDTAELAAEFGWTPDGDQGHYSYNVRATTGSYDVWVIHSATTDWVRCDSRMDNCCDGKGTVSACP